MRSEALLRVFSYRPNTGIMCAWKGLVLGASAPVRNWVDSPRTSFLITISPFWLDSTLEILFDIYHMQKNEGHLIPHIEMCWDEIAYFQIGDNPGRKEPTTGEINYKNIFKYIYNKGYRGVMGMEHGNAQPGKEGELALIKAYRESDSFM